MHYLSPKVKMSLLVAVVAVGLDLLFHIVLTNPMETFDYFVVKALLAFLVATLFLNWRAGADDVSNANSRSLIVWFSAGFSFLMSLYYRWWEYFSDVPFSVRAPDIIFLDRSNVLLFAGTWFFAHAIFFFIGIQIAKRLVKPNSDRG